MSAVVSENDCENHTSEITSCTDDARKNTYISGQYLLRTREFAPGLPLA